MKASVEQLSQVSVLADLETADKLNLQPHAQVKSYRKDEIILHKGDCLPAKLYAVVGDSND